MEDETKVNLDAEEQDVDTGVDNESNDSSDSDEKYLSQKARAEKAERELKEMKARMEELETLKEKKVESKKPEAKEDVMSSLQKRLDEQDLLIAGVKEDEDKELVLKYAKSEGVTVAEALNSRFVQIGLKANKEERAERNAAINPTNRTGDKGGDATLRKAIAHYNKTGDVMDGLDVATTNKLFTYIKNNK